MRRIHFSGRFDMSNITGLDLGTLFMFLDYLFNPYRPEDDPEAVAALEKALDVMQRSYSMKVFLPSLESAHGELAAMPEVVAEVGQYLSVELAEADFDHDGFGGATHHISEAIRRLPRAAERVKKAAARLQTEVIPALADLRQSYAKEAANARARRPIVAELADDLRAMPTPDGGTLYDWAMGYIEAGERLHGLLQQASLRKAAAARRPDEVKLAGLRTRVVSLISRARQRLAEEVALGTNDLPENAEQLVFGYLDRLIEENTPRSPGRN